MNVEKNVDTSGADWRRWGEVGISCEKWGSREDSAHCGGSAENGTSYAYR